MRSVQEKALRPAVFLDRDGTLIEEVPYLADPGRVRLLPGAAEALRRWRASGFACVLVTNQSGIGRGLLSVETLQRIHDELTRQLDAEGVALDGIEYCPFAPTTGDPTVIEHFDRKPGPGMLLRASRTLGLDLSRCWMIGDTLVDLLAGHNAGCRGSVLVGTGKGLAAGEDRLAPPHDNVEDLLGAVALILEATADDNPGTARFDPVGIPGSSD